MPGDRYQTGDRFLSLENFLIKVSAYPVKGIESRVGFCP